MDYHLDNNPTFAHLISIIVLVVGFFSPDHGHCCEKHNPCSVVVEESIVLRVMKKQILTLREEQMARCMYWVTIRINCCQVGFLKKAFITHAEFNCTLIELIEVYSPHDEDNIKRQNFFQNMRYAEKFKL